MEVFENNDLMRQIILHLNLKDVLYFFKSNKVVKQHVREILIDLLPAMLMVDNNEKNNINISEFIFELLKINEIDFAKKTYNFYKALFPDTADINISAINLKYFKQLINIVPPDFNWYYLNEYLNDTVLPNEEFSKELIDNVFIPALDANITIIIETFVDAWEENRDNYPNMQYMMDPLVTKAKNKLEMIRG